MLHRLTGTVPRDFIHLFLEKNDLYPYFNKVSDRLSEKEVYRDESKISEKTDPLHYLVFDIPGYYSTSPFQEYRQKTIRSFKGSLILLTSYSSYKQLLKAKFSSKQRAEFKRQKRKLCQSFDITHQFYHGSISKSLYDQLFDQFKEMLIMRFREKGIKNDDLPHWSHYHRTFYSLINSKRACISVISHNQKPICFSVNLIYGNTLYGYLKSYDVDFAKYSLGMLELLGLLEWAYANGIEKFDLLKGQYTYKSKLIDKEYYFIKSVLYHKSSTRAILFGNLTYSRIYLFYNLIRLMKKIKLDKLYKKLSTWWFRQRNKKYSPVSYSIRKREGNTSDVLGERIQLNSDTGKYLKKPLVDFLFASGERIQDVAIYSVRSENRTFLFQGKENSREVILDNNTLNQHYE
ncbi:GNAT family N-acetyltransferase [Muriicola soli]|uniref:GNAT family N-acetyltransferase n=1 Tax=Muriicola soli TaxID=2507538 RepID=UPI0013ED2348|nr:GNAT family N-acetyltransferase [Muriicola soli]